MAARPTFCSRLRKVVHLRSCGTTVAGQSTTGGERRAGYAVVAWSGLVSTVEPLVGSPGRAKIGRVNRASRLVTPVALPLTGWHNWWAPPGTTPKPL
jgi:hypothetical protein